MQLKRQVVLFFFFGAAWSCCDGDSGGDSYGGDDEDCAPDQYQACAADGNVRWFDSCYEEGEIAERCPKQNAECFAVSDVEAECRCVNRWEGEECDVCPGKWDPQADCNNCVNGWDPNSECTACLPNWSGEECETCIFYAKAGAAASAADGLTWQTAYSGIQEAIDAAYGAANPAGPFAMCEVWVSAGTYFVYDTKPEDTIQLRPGVALLGGFAGNETSRAERDWYANRTALDGRMAQGGTISVYYAVTGADFSLLDGFAITGGNPNGSGSLGGGGGMYNDGASPTVANCIFAGTASEENGGGMYNADNEPIIANTVFTGTSAEGYGGGMYNKDSNPTIFNCVFAGATATIGGAVYNMNSTPLVLNSVFTGNSAQIGGGMYNKDVSSAAIVNTTFTGNDSMNDGGGMRNVNSTPTLRNSILFDNTPDAIHSDNTSTCDAAHSDIEGGSVFPGDGNKMVAPVFREVAAGSGSWSGISFDHASFRTSLVDAEGAWTEDALAGLFVQPNLNDTRRFVVAGNTVNTVHVLSDITAIVQPEDSYQIFDLHLGTGSQCIDSGDNAALPQDILDLDSDSDTDESIPFDLDGKERTNNSVVDMGAYEY